MKYFWWSDHVCPCRKASYINTFWLMWKLPNNAEPCILYKICFFLLRWKNRCWLTWRLQSVSSSLSRTRRRTSPFIFSRGKWLLSSCQRKMVTILTISNNFNDHSYFSLSMKCQFLWCLFLEACTLGVSFKVFVCRLNFMHTDWWRYLSDGTCRCRTGNKRSLESALISM